MLGAPFVETVAKYAGTPIADFPHFPHCSPDDLDLILFDVWPRALKCMGIEDNDLYTAPLPLEP